MNLVNKNNTRAHKKIVTIFSFKMIVTTLLTFITSMGDPDVIYIFVYFN